MALPCLLCKWCSPFDDLQNSLRASLDWKQAKKSLISITLKVSWKINLWALKAQCYSMSFTVLVCSLECESLTSNRQAVLAKLQIHSAEHWFSSFITSVHFSHFNQEPFKFWKAPSFIDSYLITNEHFSRFNQEPSNLR